MMGRWRTAITKTEPNRLLIRGYDIEDLIGRVSFSDVVHLVLAGELPPPRVSRMLDAILVAFVDYGIAAPSVRVARLCASVGVDLAKSAAAGLIAFSGIYHGGAIGPAAELLRAGVQRAEREGLPLEEVAVRIVREHLDTGRRLPGYGHPINKERDPRTHRLLSLARELGFEGKHVRLCELIHDALFRESGRRLIINPDAAAAAILLDMGYDVPVIAAFNAIARTAGLIAHGYEEVVREEIFRKEELENVVYDGPPKRELPARG
jgi:citrate synthase